MQHSTQDLQGHSEWEKGVVEVVELSRGVGGPLEKLPSEQ